jgi:DEAD/DEAH box helicase domain-containing protein
MHQRFEALITSGHLTVIEQIDVPAVAERRSPIPNAFDSGRIGEWLRKIVAQDGSLWRHQSLGLAEIDEGSNVVLATSTASGKSLVFQTAIFKEILEGGGKAIVFYPLKALLADQLSHWRRLARMLGLSEDIVGELHGQVLADEDWGVSKTLASLSLPQTYCKHGSCGKFLRPYSKNSFVQYALLSWTKLMFMNQYSVAT